MTAVVWLLLLVPLAAGLACQGLVRAVYRRYSAVPNRLGVTGAEAARALLDARGLRGVRVEVIPGVLNDHYDGETKALRLSAPVGTRRSVAALGIAGHEVSHAFQDAEGSWVYRARQSIGLQLARLAPWSTLFLIGGFWFGVPLFIGLSLLFVGGLVLFALVTLPVEIGASQRALHVLRATGLADAAEFREIRRVLRAAALTYVAGLLDRLGFFLLLLFVAEAARRATS